MLRKNSASQLAILSLSALTLCACETQTAFQGVIEAAQTDPNGGNPGGPGGPGGPSPSPSPSSSSNPNLMSATEQFDASSINSKKIDLVLDIDNSGSMQSEQAKVKDGLSAVAAQYFGLPGLDVCVTVISSARYLGTGNTKEVAAGCTGVMGAQSVINATGSAISGLGIAGSGTELLGKSLVTFMYGEDKWDNVDQNNLQNNAVNPFFRQGASVGIVFASDENNYFNNYDNDFNESKNDIPSAMGQMRPMDVGSSAMIADTRKGIVEYLNDGLGRAQSGQRTSLSFIKLLNGQPAPHSSDSYGNNMGAVNLFPLAAQMGNGSLNADIDGGTNYYKAQFNSLLSTTIAAQSQFMLAHRVADLNTIVVKRIRQGAADRVIVRGSGYQLGNNNQSVQLQPSEVSLLQAGDEIRVSYQY